MTFEPFFAFIEPAASGAAYLYSLLPTAGLTIAGIYFSPSIISAITGSIAVGIGLALSQVFATTALYLLTEAGKFLWDEACFLFEVGSSVCKEIGTQVNEYFWDCYRNNNDSFFGKFATY